MISLTQIYKQKLLLNPINLDPFKTYRQALDWINLLDSKKKVKIKLGKVGKRPTYFITDDQIHTMNKEAYKVFCSRLHVMEQSKQKYEQAR